MHSDAQHTPNLNSKTLTPLENPLKAFRQFDQAVTFNNCSFKASLYLRNNNFSKARPQTPVPNRLHGLPVRNKWGRSVVYFSFYTYSSFGNNNWIHGSHYRAVLSVGADLVE